MLRRRASGTGFALGWGAASLLARERLADILVSRAIDGQVETITRPDGKTIQRHRHDNRLARAMLTRLDRLADPVAFGRNRTALQLPAHTVAQEFNAFLALVEADRAPEHAAHFLDTRIHAARYASMTDQTPACVTVAERAGRFERTGFGMADEVDTSDLDPEDRAHWSAEQWQRADAAGLVHVADLSDLDGDDDDDDDDWDEHDAHLDEDDVHNPQLPQLSVGGKEEPPLVWYDGFVGEYRTRLPAPSGFAGVEYSDRVSPFYTRDLSDQEKRAVAHCRDRGGPA